MKFQKAVTHGLAAAGLLASAMAMPTAANASVTFTATGTGANSDLSASVTFDINGSNQLVVTLANISTADVDPSTAKLLYAVFFDTPAALGTGTAAVSSGSAIYQGDQNPTQIAPTGTDVSEYFGYAYNAAGLSNPALPQFGPFGTSGIGSAGLGIFGNALNGDNSGVDGTDYGITSAGDVVTTGNNGLLTIPIIKNSVTFLFDIEEGFSLSDIGNVSFQYGTTLSDPHLTTVPLPAAAWLFGSALLGVVGIGSRRRWAA